MDNKNKVTFVKDNKNINNNLNNIDKNTNNTITNDILLKKDNSSSNIDETKNYEEIKQIIENSLKEIDTRFFNENFNIINELIEVFGDPNPEKVRHDMERLESLDKRLDSVLKVLVKKHSSELFGILGFMKQIDKENEYFQSKLSEASEFIASIKHMTKLITNSNTSEWKLRSIYFSEIISKLNKVLNILKILTDCEEFLIKNKIYETVLLVKKSSEDHFVFDKEFRKFDMLTSINERFEKVKLNITKKLIKLFNQCIFLLFDNSGYSNNNKNVSKCDIKISSNCDNNAIISHDLIYDKSIDSVNDSIIKNKAKNLLIYFFNSYNNIPIISELHNPFMKALNNIKNVVFKLIDKSKNDLDYFANFNLKTKDNNEDHNFNFSYNLNFNLMEFESEHKSSSLVYFIKCTSIFNDSYNILVVIKECFEENLLSFISRLTTSISDIFKKSFSQDNLYFNSNKDSNIINSNINVNNVFNNKNIDKIKIISYFQCLLCNIFHLKIKFISIYNAFNNYYTNKNNLNNSNISNANIINKLFEYCMITIEKSLLIPLLAYISNSSAEIYDNFNITSLLSEFYNYKVNNEINSNEYSKLSNETFLNNTKKNFETSFNESKLIMQEALNCNYKCISLVIRIYFNYITYNNKFLLPNNSYSGFNKLINISYNKLSDILNKINIFYYNNVLSDYIMPKSIINNNKINLLEYDLDNNNFNSFSDLLNKFQMLNEIFILGIESSSLELLKIIAKIIYRVNFELKIYLKDLKIKNCYNDVLDVIIESYIKKTNDVNNYYNEDISINLKHILLSNTINNETLNNNKNLNNNSLYTSFKNNYKVDNKLNINNEENIKSSLNNYRPDNINYLDKENADYIKHTSRFILNNTRSDAEHINLINKSYKNLETFLKFISCLENLIISFDTFINNVIEKAFSKGKIKAIIQQYNAGSFHSSLQEYKTQFKSNKKYNNIELEDNLDCNQNNCKTNSDLLDKNNTSQKNLSINSISVVYCLCLNLIGETNRLYTNAVIQSKVELSSIFISLFKSMSKTGYWLNEPQMNPDYFVNNFINEYSKHLSLYKQLLPEKLIKFCNNKQDFLLNYLFLKQLSSLYQNSINILGINLLIRNYEKIINSGIFISNNFDNTNVITTSIDSNIKQNFKDRIDYFPNYIKLLLLTDEKLIEKLKEYFSISTFSQEFLEVLLSINTNINKKFSDNEKDNIYKSILS